MIETEPPICFVTSLIDSLNLALYECALCVPEQLCGKKSITLMERQHTCTHTDATHH